MILKSVLGIEFLFGCLGFFIESRFRWVKLGIIHRNDLSRNMLILFFNSLEVCFMKDDDEGNVRVLQFTYTDGQLDKRWIYFLHAMGK